MTVDLAPLHTADLYVYERTARPQPEALARGVVVGLTLSVLLFWLPLLVLVGLA